MNKGIDELRTFLPEFQRKKEESFFQKICRKFIKEKGFTPIKKKLDSPYLVVKMSINDFKKSTIRYVGSKPNWDTNWGHMFYCIEAKFNWEKNEVSCIFQNENESLNSKRVFGDMYNNPVRIISNIRYPPNIYDW